jgi:hypothetical protein
MDDSVPLNGAGKMPTPQEFQVIKFAFLKIFGDARECVR